MTRTLAFLVMLALTLTAGSATASPAGPPSFQRTVRGHVVQVPIPPDARAAGTYPNAQAYEMRLADRAGHAQLEIELRVGASDQKVPQNDTELRQAFLSIIHSTRLPIRDDQIHISIVDNVNTAFRVAYAGIFPFRAKSGKVVYLSLGVMVSRHKDFVVPILALGGMVSSSATPKEINLAQRYLAGMMVSMIRGSSVR